MHGTSSDQKYKKRKGERDRERKKWTRKEIVRNKREKMAQYDSGVGLRNKKPTGFFWIYWSSARGKWMRLLLFSCYSSSLFVLPYSTLLFRFPQSLSFYVSFHFIPCQSSFSFHFHLSSYCAYLTCNIWTKDELTLALSEKLHRIVLYLHLELKLVWLNER